MRYAENLSINLFLRYRGLYNATGGDVLMLAAVVVGVAVGAATGSSVVVSIALIAATVTAALLYVARMCYVRFTRESSRCSRFLDQVPADTSFYISLEILRRYCDGKLDLPDRMVIELRWLCDLHFDLKEIELSMK